MYGSLLWDDEFTGSATTAKRANGNSLIKRRQFAPFVRGQSQQVGAGDLSWCDDHMGLEDGKDADVLSPKVMAGSPQNWRREVIAPVPEIP